MSSQPISRRGFLGVFGSLVAWWQGTQQATAAPPQARVYRTLFRFETTVANGKRRMRVDPVGSALDVTDLPEERAARFSFDEAPFIPLSGNRPTTTTYVYSSDKVLAPPSDADGGTTTYTYDEAGLVTTTYDAAGQICQVQEKDVTTNDVAKQDPATSRTVWTPTGSISTYVSGGVQYEITIEYRYGLTMFQE